MPSLTSGTAASGKPATAVSAAGQAVGSRWTLLLLLSLYFGGQYALGCLFGGLRAVVHYAMGGCGALFSGISRFFKPDHDPSSASQTVTVFAVSGCLLLGAGLGSSSAAYAAPRPTFPQLEANFKPAQGVYISDETNSRMTITATKPNALLKWQSFDVARGNTLEFASGGSHEVSFLNIVTGATSSRIDGTIKAKTGDNINFYLLNPHGITLSSSGALEDLKSVYLGTSKPTAELIAKVNSAGDKPLQLADLKDSLSLGRGMGRVELLGSVQSTDLVLNGSQIVIGDIDTVLNVGEGDIASVPNIEGNGAYSSSLEVLSSTGRIDIGYDGDEELKQAYKDVLAEHGLVPEGTTSSEGQVTFVDHFDEQLIANTEDFRNKIYNKGANKDNKFWLATDLDFNAEAGWDEEYFTQIQNMTFSGQLDGTFHSITYQGEVVRPTGGAGSAQDSYGLFGKLDGATVKNLKVVNSAWNVKDTANPVQIGALAGAITNSTLENVEVENFRIEGAADLASDSVIGGVAGLIDAGNHFTNVMGNIAAVDSADGVAIGTFAGKVTSPMDIQGVAVGYSTDPDLAALSAIGVIDGDGIDVSAIASDLNAAYDQALERMGKDDLYAAYAVGGDSTQGTASLKHKGFLRPFFIEDYNYTYDGTKHDYKDLVSNEWFDLEQYVHKSDTSPDYVQKNAGQYYFDFTTADVAQDDSLAGHDFYFSYQYAAETWDDPDGLGAEWKRDADKMPADGLVGQGFLNINKKPIRIEVNDQTITEGDQPNTDVGKDTIGNYDDVVNNTVPGDDLGLTITVPDNFGQGGDDLISVEITNPNYEPEVVPGDLTVKPKPQPEPQPEPTPEPGPTPEPIPEPTPNPDHIPEPAPEPSPAPVPQPQPQPVIPDENKNDLQETLGLVETERKCVYCTDLNPYNRTGITQLHNSVRVNLATMDYSKPIFAALERGVSPAALYTALSGQPVLDSHLPDVNPSKEDVPYRLAMMQGNQGTRLDLKSSSMDFNDMRADFVLAMESLDKDESQGQSLEPQEMLAANAKTSVAEPYQSKEETATTATTATTTTADANTADARKDVVAETQTAQAQDVKRTSLPEPVLASL